MRLLAVLASLAVATAAASLPASFVTTVGETSPAVAGSDAPGDERGPIGSADTRGEPEEDDDLDERFDELDDLVAVLGAETATFVRCPAQTSWPVHDARSPRAPHREDTLRPPIAA